MNRFGMANSALATFLESLHCIRPIRIKKNPPWICGWPTNHRIKFRTHFFVIDELCRHQLYISEVMPITYFFAMIFFVTRNDILYNVATATRVQLQTMVNLMQGVLSWQLKYPHFYGVKIV